MAIMDLLYIHGFCVPLPTCSSELSPLQGSSVGVQNHKIEIYREYLLCRYRVTCITGGELRNGVNGFLMSYATDSVRFSQQILDKEHAGATNVFIRWQI